MIFIFTSLDIVVLRTVGRLGRLVLVTVVVLRTGGRGGDVGEGEVEVNPRQCSGVEGVEAGHQAAPVWSARGLNNESHSYLYGKTFPSVTATSWVDILQRNLSLFNPLNGKVSPKRGNIPPKMQSFPSIKHTKKSVVIE